MKQVKRSKYKEKLETTQERTETRKPRPMNDAQKYYLQCLETCPIVISYGCPGTSKTYLPAALAAYWLANHKISNVVIARQAEKTSMGFLPGSADQKLEGLMRPSSDAMIDVLGKTKFEYFRKKGQIEFANLDEIKGRTFHDTFLIVDEAEDCDQATMKAILTRIGEGSTFVINGDSKQGNIKGKSGLDLAKELAKVVDFEIPIIEFGIEDIVRSGVCKSVIVGMVKMGIY